MTLRPAHAAVASISETSRRLRAFTKGDPLLPAPRRHCGRWTNQWNFSRRHRKRLGWLQAIAYIATYGPALDPVRVAPGAPRPCRRAARLLRRPSTARSRSSNWPSSGSARRSTSATKSSTTASLSTGCAAWAQCSSRTSTRCPMAVRWCFRAWRAETGPGRRAGARAGYFRRHLPFVSKVHRQAERLIEAGRHILFIGHAVHPEVIGTSGQVPRRRNDAGRNRRDAERIAPIDPANLAFLTQTTLSVDDTAEIIAILSRRFPTIRAPPGRGYLLTRRPIARPRSRRSRRSASGC